jgi:SAM-dependent methyltransferase
MLRVGAPRAEIVRAGETLRALARDDADGFAALFDPLAPRGLVGGVDRTLATALRGFGLVDGDDDALRGLHRIRRLDDRCYVLEVGDGPEYVQDVWPETDALLALLAATPPGRLADVGTGSGVLAVEAAARGHEVVATDLYDSALALARFNAILNGVDVGVSGGARGGTVELRRGHLFEPLRGRAFDLVLTAPHYGRVADQLRLEVLRDGPAHLADGGTLALATALEWEGDGPLAIEPLLCVWAGRGVSARVRPIESAVKRHWFERAVGEVPRLVSRHRFLVTLTRTVGAAAVAIERPRAETMPTRVHVPLARLLGPRAGAVADAAAWTVTTAADVAALSSLLDELAAPELTFAAPFPERLHDACRYGAMPCVAARGQAAGAILDGDGGVRPCSHGQPLARADDSLATLAREQQAAAAQAFARRGCRDCVARDVCSRCLYPVGFADERGYCDFVRAHLATLPRLRRLVATLQRLDGAGLSPPVRIGRWPRRAWQPPDAVITLAEAIAAAWNQSEVWLISSGNGHRLTWLRDGELWDADVDADAAALGVALADGAAPSLAGDDLDRALRRLGALLVTS